MHEATLSSTYTQQDLFEELAQKYGTPLLIIDHAVIRDNFRTFRQLLPRVKPFYAIKANPEESIVRTLFNEGAGFDIASLEEFDTLRRVIPGGYQEQRAFFDANVVFANTIKNFKALDTMQAYNVPMTFDNEVELDKIATRCRHVPLILRLEVPNDGAVVELSSKFGARFENCPDLLKHADMLGLNVIGVSFHVGSQCEKPGNFTIAFQRARQLFDDVEATGHKFTVLDIGGGFPAPYNSSVAPMEAFASLINRLIDTYFPSNDVQIIAEPGRFFVATAATAVATVIGKSKRNGRPYYYIDDGVYNTFSGLIYDHIQYHFNAFKTGNATPSAVAGPTCDALDMIAKDDPLPDLDVGDLVYSENVGAYTNASATFFNGFQPAKIVHLNE
nr:type III PLP-dependent enzyme [Candidatus Sigynarchaeum springense]